MQLLSPFNPRYFTPELIAIMRPRTLNISKRVEPENEGDEATTIETQLGLSKKDELLRRQELRRTACGARWPACSATRPPT